MINIVNFACTAIALAGLVVPVQAEASEHDHLLQTHWYQDGPFAQFTPGQERVGCWSTAYAQILFFHRLRPSGRVQYECSSGQKVDVDLAQYHFNWSRFPNEITADTSKKELEQLALYSFGTATVARKDFGTGGYKRLLNSTADLEAHFPVDAEIYVHLGDKLPMSAADLSNKMRSEKIFNVIDRPQIVSLLRTELAARRPVYFHFGNLKDFGHSTVIDGIREESGRQMVHINFGAREASQNKWYDLFAAISQPDDTALRAFVTVKPRSAKAEGNGHPITSLTGGQLESVLREKIPPLLSEYRVPAAAVAVIRNGEVVATVVIGEQEHGKPATRSTLFNVASLTKPVAAHAFLALVDKGAFDLDESLAPYWVDPDVRNDARHSALSARIILSHQTGFPNWRDGKKLQFGFTPSEGVGYSGEGFEYLWRAVEAKMRRDMLSLVTNTVLSACDMSDTHFVWDAAFAGRFALEHDKEGRRIQVEPKFAPSPADDLITTITDYGRFAAWVARGAGLSSNLFNQARSVQIPGRIAAKVTEPADYGLCWRIITTEHGTALIHGGSDRGVRAGVLIVPETQAGVVIMTNGDNGGRIIEAVVPLALEGGAEFLAQYTKPTGRK